MHRRLRSSNQSAPAHIRCGLAWERISWTERIALNSAKTHPITRNAASQDAVELRPSLQHAALSVLEAFLGSTRGAAGGRGHTSSLSRAASITAAAAAAGSCQLRNHSARAQRSTAISGADHRLREHGRGAPVAGQLAKDLSIPELCQV